MTTFKKKPCTFTMTLVHNWEEEIRKVETRKSDANRRVKAIDALILDSVVVEETENSVVYALVN